MVEAAKTNVNRTSSQSVSLAFQNSEDSIRRNILAFVGLCAVGTGMAIGLTAKNGWIAVIGGAVACTTPVVLLLIWELV